MASPPSDSVVVIGGANVDIRARSAAPAVPATSNPGTTYLRAGGVARNVAENLARLGTPVSLVAAVGDDPLGDLVLAATDEAGVDVTAVLRVTHGTGTYTAILDADGELVSAVADMAATDGLTPDDVRRQADLVTSAALLVLDGNLAPATLAAALELAVPNGVRVVLDPVSVPKAARLAPVLTEVGALFTLTPTETELAALGDIGSGVEHLWVRRGPAGSTLDDVPLPVVPGPVVDVTGAGDAMLAAYCHRILTGRTPVEAARFAHGAAALTVASPHTVRPDLDVDLVEETLRRSP